MATSFAALASQFLNRPQNGESSMASSQPLFFSFSTDSAGSRAQDSELNDQDDPHLREDQDASRHPRHSHSKQGDDDDPYLQLDEDDDSPSIPLMSTSRGDPSSPPSPQGGWLAHQASPLGYSRSPSPARSDSTESGPPQEFLHQAPPVSGSAAQSRQPQRLLPQQTRPPRSLSRSRRQEPQSLSLTESLLPRDGHARPLDVFSLPDPRHVPRGRRKYNDAPWTAVWLTGVTLCFFFSILLLFTTNSRPDGKKRGQFPYTTLLHTVPLITILTFMSALAAYSHVFLLRIFVGPVMFITSVFVPATLFISAIWAFVGSFMWDGDQEPTWGETTGLRLFAIIPLLLSLYTARRLLHLPRHIHATSSTLTLATKLLIANPLLLALSPSILLLTLLISIPFVTLIFRLLLVGYSTLSRSSSKWEWHIRGWAHWAIAGAVVVWLWTWGVSRGILRMTCASVIGAWYFSDPDVLPRPPLDTHTMHAALTRSTGPSLGTVVLSALILTGIRILSMLTMFLNRLPLYVSYPMVISGVRFAVGFLDGVTTALSKHALVYAGLTGDAFMPSARRSRALTAASEIGLKTEPPLTLLTIAPLTLTFPFALSTYLFVAHTLDAPDEALGAAVLAGGVTALVGLFCVGLVRDTADTLYVCYSIDKDMGVKRVGRDEVAAAFEYRTSPHAAAAAAHGRGRSGGFRQPSPSPGPSTRTVWSLPRSQPQPARSQPPPPQDINPFEQSYLDEDEDVEQQRPAPRQSAVQSPTSPLMRSKPLEDSYASQARSSKDRDSVSSSEDEDESIFPGSGLF